MEKQKSLDYILGITTGTFSIIELLACTGNSFSAET